MSSLYSTRSHSDTVQSRNPTVFIQICHTVWHICTKAVGLCDCTVVEDGMLVKGQRVTSLHCGGKMACLHTDSFTLAAGRHVCTVAV